MPRKTTTLLANEIKAFIQNAAPKKVAEAKPARVAKSTIEGPTKRVWAIADSMKDAKRKDVIAACVERGIATGTARTQYQCWIKASRTSV